jgi:hypothetical protein
MNNETETCEVDTKLEWQTPQLIDLDEGLISVALALGAVNDGEGAAVS